MHIQVFHVQVVNLHVKALHDHELSNQMIENIQLINVDQIYFSIEQNKLSVKTKIVLHTIIVSSKKTLIGRKSTCNLVSSKSVVISTQSLSQNPIGQGSLSLCYKKKN